jgi:diguanylate cyclase (GGDEF)-like protein/PAS domain S-box-containing protein
MARLDRLAAQDYQYRLWKLDPNTGKAQNIASSTQSDSQWSEAVEFPLATPNGTWYFAVSPTHGWRNYESIAINAFLGLLISSLLGWISKQFLDLRNNRRDLSTLVDERTKELTIEVAERTLAQETATTEALRLAAILETAGDGIHILNMDGVLVEGNRAFFEMLGYDIAFKGKLHVSDWDAQNDWATIKQRHDQLLDSGGALVFETRHKRSDGHVIDVEVNAVSMKIGDKRYVYAASRDISSRKEQEAQRFELLGRLQRISANLPGLIYQYLLRPDGTSCFPYASDAMLDIYRVTPLEVRDDASKVLATLHPDDQISVADSIQISARNLTRWRKEYRVKFDDGTVLWLAGNASPEKNPDGSVLWYGFIADITAQKLADQKLIDSELRLRTLIKAIPDLVWLKNTKGVYLLCNSRFEQFFGAPSDTILGKTDYDFVAKDLADAFGSNDQMAIEMNGACINEEWVTFGSDGHRELLETTKTPVYDVSGEAIGVLGIGHNITERHFHEIALKESESRFREIFNAVSDAILIYEPTGRILDVNRGMCDMYGYTHEQALKCTPYDLCFDEAPYSAIEALQKIKLAQTEGPQSFDWLARTRDGRAVWTSVSIKLASIGQHERILAVVRDVSVQKEAQTKLELAANVFGYAREGITITDAHGTIIDVNEAFTRITGYSREDVIGQNPRILSSGKQDLEFYRQMWAALTEQGHWTGEIWNRRKNGEVFAEMLTISAVRNAQGQAQQYVSLFSDISAIKAHQTQLEHIAHFDALTQLPNRLLLADRLRQGMAQAYRRKQHLAVAYLDLDGFKVVNDRYGHDVGDQLLMSLAIKMNGTLREGDTMARIGGDEFVAVFIDLKDVASCAPMLTRLMEVAASKVQVGGQQLQVSASIGVAFFPQDQDIDADQLLRQADQAMYQAKLSGKNRFHVFDPVKDSSMRIHHEGIERIRLALLQHEFVLYYQPKVNMRSGKVIGVEALIRWQHPERGLLAPGLFLPVIEDDVLAVDLGEWVMDMALTQVEHWHAAGLDLPVSVNIGARQLQQSNFFQRMQAILAKHPHVSPASLELEVLETSALADISQVSKVIEDCAQIGVRFALDDFGTGYSSLTYLKRLHVALIKIDQSFVRDMLVDPDDLAILEGVIGLAAAFERNVIAEGVETVEHGTALLHLGCELAQGYGIARPMPAEQMPAWVATWQPDVAWSDLPWLGGNPTSGSE